MRYTKKDIQWRIDRLNAMMKNHSIKINLEGRYGYSAIDLYRLNGDCVGTVTTGKTKNQIVEFLDAMEIGIRLVNEGRI